VRPLLLGLVASIGCSSARVPLVAPDAQPGGDVTSAPDVGFAAVDAFVAPDAIAWPDAAPSPDRIETGSFCRNDCDCDFSLACLGGSCQIADRNNLCCSNPFCPAGATCEEFVCGGCCPRGCIDVGATCGPIGDGCGGLLQCGTCAAPETCGGGGVASQCGSPPDAGCVPITCPEVGANCGVMSDRCGGTIQCGSCTLPDSCGGGGTPFVCGTKPPPTCAVDGGTSD
jgi:hypothetical protein